MKRKELAKEFARGAHLPPAAAQDLVDEMAHEILRRLRAGEPVDLAEIERNLVARPMKKKLAGGR